MKKSFWGVKILLWGGIIVDVGVDFQAQENGSG